LSTWTIRFTPNALLTFGIDCIPATPRLNACACATSKRKEEKEKKKKEHLAAGEVSALIGERGGGLHSTRDENRNDN